MRSDGRSGDLFANRPQPPQTLARNSDPITSQMAAEMIVPHLGEIEAAVLAFAADRPDGFTDVELNAHFNITGSTYRSRRHELTQRGLIRDSGEMRAHAKAGIVRARARRHIVWQITLAGLKQAG